MRRKVSAGRAELRRGVQIVVAVTVGVRGVPGRVQPRLHRPLRHPGRAGRAGGRGRHLRGGVRLDAEAVRTATGRPVPGPPRAAPRPGGHPVAGHPGRHRTRHLHGGWSGDRDDRCWARCSAAACSCWCCGCPRRRPAPLVQLAQLDAPHHGHGCGCRAGRCRPVPTGRARPVSGPDGVAGEPTDAAAASPTPACGRTWPSPAAPSNRPWAARCCSPARDCCHRPARLLRWSGRPRPVRAARRVHRSMRGGAARRGVVLPARPGRRGTTRPSGARSSAAPSGAYLDLVALEMAGSAAPAEALPAAAKIGTGWPLALIRDTLYRATRAGQRPLGRAGRPGPADRRHRTARPRVSSISLVAHDGARVRSTLTARAHDHAPTRTGRPARAGREGRPEHADGAGPHRPGLPAVHRLPRGGRRHQLLNPHTNTLDTATTNLRCTTHRKGNRNDH